MNTKRAGVDFKALVFVEPALIPREHYRARIKGRAKALEIVSQSISRRRDEWKSREDAAQYYKTRIPWQLWDQRVLDLFVVRHLL